VSGKAGRTPNGVRIDFWWDLRSTELCTPNGVQKKRLYFDFDFAVD